jgi:hypothetical protein
MSLQQLPAQLLVDIFLEDHEPCFRSKVVKGGEHKGHVLRSCCFSKHACVCEGWLCLRQATSFRCSLMVVADVQHFEAATVVAAAAAAAATVAIAADYAEVIQEIKASRPGAQHSAVIGFGGR